MKKQASIILASASPRRKYLLEQAGLEFSVQVSHVDETCPASATPVECARMLAEAKARAVAQDHPSAWVIGADTIVVSQGRVCGKPHSLEQAREMLTLLSGKTHQVFTGYCLHRLDQNLVFSGVASTDVTFKDLTQDEIAWYLETGEPFDKAGAYAIQGLGTFLVKRISGSYTNVVGLPVCEVVELLMEQRVIHRNGENHG